MAETRTSRASQKVETRRLLVQAGRELFAGKGYHATGTHEIVNHACVTRGALQHHFPRKEDLFLAVFQEVRSEWNVKATQDNHGTDNQWLQLREHIRVFLRGAIRPEFHRIVMIDGPAVLGWKTWRDLQTADGLDVVTAAVSDGMRDGFIKPQDPEALVNLTIALIEESALLIAFSDDPDDAIAKLDIALETLLSNLV